MAIRIDESQRFFQLDGREMSYAFRINALGIPVHLHFGGRVVLTRPQRLAESYILPYMTNYGDSSDGFSLDTCPQELPLYGVSDYRQPALFARFENGGTAFEMVYEGYRLFEGKPPLPGLPSVFEGQDGKAQTLVVTLAEKEGRLKAELWYSVFDKYNAIMRHTRIINSGASPVTLETVVSCALDFTGNNYDVINFSGAWGRERYPDRVGLKSGERNIRSNTGASGHTHNPALILCDGEATETHGEAFGVNLVYSGSHFCSAEVGAARDTRILAGINPQGFQWHLEPGEVFCTPEAVLVYSDMGFGKMSREYHDLYRSHLVKSTYAHKERPVLINNWEATYFNFSSEKLTAIARSAKKLGLELFVLDDGWFGKRHDDKSSLGDWFVNTDKLLGGLNPLVEEINRMGMDFGLWVEPEMISPDSELYRAHPDWCLHSEGVSRLQARNQLTLDLSRQDVRSYLVETLSDVFNSAPIRYVKWDMNRPMSNAGSPLLPPKRQGEVAHRYILGLYEILEELIARFPYILFEGCAGGGGRFDPGILYYMPQIWTSDNSDAIERLKIQHGTSFFYPAIAMGCHVSAVPNHQTGRVTPLKTRGHVALQGSFGYELDLSSLSSEDEKEIEWQTAFYKTIRHLILKGDFYRLSDPLTSDFCAWATVSKDKSEAFVTVVRGFTTAITHVSRLRLAGLEPSYCYKDTLSGEEYMGSELENAGLRHLFAMRGDFSSIALHLVRVK